ncbi:MAG: hypothetical protein JNG49_00740 [Peptostreptococcus stomatis]|uniref:hypothetical protein n=1 Tax=Peptostreptococcus stomatis TaxID=341694 RepID=UPI001A63F2CD|nr:hypothetical protein [Peptostreptococcus stomatis]MBL6464919.1 hypothetical protein [Peptostreptococcus stomatis]
MKMIKTFFALFVLLLSLSLSTGCTGGSASTNTRTPDNIVDSILSDLNIKEKNFKVDSKYDDVGFPSDGFRYIVVKFDRDISVDIEKNFNNYSIDKLDYNKSIESIEKYCDIKELVDTIKIDFSKNKDSVYGIKKVFSDKDAKNKDLASKIYILSFDKSIKTLYVLIDYM